MVIEENAESMLNQVVSLKTQTHLVLNQQSILNTPKLGRMYRYAYKTNCIKQLFKIIKNNRCNKKNKKRQSTQTRSEYWLVS